MITYLIKTVICSGALILIYRLLLESESFHVFKRLYLLSSLVLCLIIPFIEVETTNDPLTLQRILPSTTMEVPLIVNNEQLGEEKDHPSVLLYAMLICYGLVVSVLLFRFTKNVVKIFRTIFQNERLQSGNVIIVLLDANVIPHTFFQYIFLNRANFENGQIEREILIHESVHARQGHSFDVLLTELLQVFFWFNPFVLFFKQAIKLNHEFLADAFTIEETNNACSYQQILLSKVGLQVTPFCSELNYSLTKKRFIMMSKKTSKSVAYSKTLLLIPILAGIIFLLSTKVVAQQNPADSQTSNGTLLKSFYVDTKNEIILEADTIIYQTSANQTKANTLQALYIVNEQRMNASILLKKTIRSKELIFYSEGDPQAMELFGKEAIRGVLVFKGASLIDVPTRTYYKSLFEQAKNVSSNSKAMVFSEVEVEPQFPGGDNAWQRYLQENLNTSTPISNNAPNGNYIAKVQFIVGADGSLRDITALSTNGFGMEEEAARIVKNGPKWIPASQNERIVQAYKKQTITFSVNRN